MKRDNNPKIQVSTMGEYQKRKKPIVGEEFLIENGKTGEMEPAHCECGKKAVVKYGDCYYCSRCWEYMG